MGRSPLYRAGIVVIAACIVVPIVSALAFALAMPDTVPLHFDFEGNVNRWGSRWELLVIGLIMALVNAMMLACYIGAERLKALNLLNAPGRDDVRTGRIILAIAAVFIVIVHFAVLGLIASTALG